MGQYGAARTNEAAMLRLEGVQARTLLVNVLCVCSLACTNVARP